MSRKMVKSGCPTAVQLAAAAAFIGTARRSCRKAHKTRIFTSVPDSSGESRLIALFRFLKPALVLTAVRYA
jgi:hypothetical protein